MNCKAIVFADMVLREEGFGELLPGADAYITKPFSPQKVIDIVQELLGVASD